MSRRSVGSVPVSCATTFHVWLGVSAYFSGGSKNTRAPAGNFESAAYVAVSTAMDVGRGDAVAGSATARGPAPGSRDAVAAHRSRICGVSPTMMSDAGAIAVRSSALGAWLARTAAPAVTVTPGL